MRHALHVLGCVLTVLSLWFFALVLLSDPLERITRYLTVSRIISFIATAWAWLTGKYNL